MARPPNEWEKKFRARNAIDIDLSCERKNLPRLRDALRREELRHDSRRQRSRARAAPRSSDPSDCAKVLGHRGAIAQAQQLPQTQDRIRWRLNHRAKDALHR
jgi:hypothetical protein